MCLFQAALPHQGIKNRLAAFNKSVLSVLKTKLELLSQMFPWHCYICWIWLGKCQQKQPILSSPVRRPRCPLPSEAVVVTSYRLKSKLLKTRSTWGSNPQSDLGERTRDHCDVDACWWLARAHVAIKLQDTFLLVKKGRKTKWCSTEAFSDDDSYCSSHCGSAHLALVGYDQKVGLRALLIEFGFLSSFPFPRAYIPKIPICLWLWRKSWEFILQSSQFKGLLTGYDRKWAIFYLFLWNKFTFHDKGNRWLHSWQLQETILYFIFTVEGSK